ADSVGGSRRFRPSSSAVLVCSEPASSDCLSTDCGVADVDSGLEKEEARLNQGKSLAFGEKSQITRFITQPAATKKSRTIQMRWQMGINMDNGFG
ncbi:Hypothetical predicted protein, partial [Olea europaea subsp. europaea]